MLYSTFYLGQTQMAVPIPCILEIGRSFKFHPVRGAPEVIDGLINLRGKVVSIVNLGLAFEESKIEPSDESRIFIFKNNSELKEVADSDTVMETAPDNIGIHVDRISDVIRVENEELQAVPANMVHPFYKHVVRRGDSFIIILEPSKILNLHETPDLLS
ncbi:MAG: chemotaxis protein CheW [Verrucomicrobiota bacterium]|nr:chemotaxis protein CheW [Verrucomicrobiota bacterium]